MTPRTALPSLAVLILLAWILGALARSGTSGSTILANSYWLVYLAYLLPILALVALVATVVYLIINWKLISDMLGFGIAARRRETRKKPSTVQLLVWMSFWSLAIAVLYWKCGGLICRNDGSEQNLTELVVSVAGDGQGPSFPSLPALSGPIDAITGLVSSPYFAFSLLGLLIVSTMIIVRSFKVSLDETRSARFLPAGVLAEGTVAVRDALKVLEVEEAGDPRTRIMACYERMVRAAAGLGANVSVDQTARELERGIRRTFHLQGQGIAGLTRLFEEARYSLHTITQQDSEKAHGYLLEIAGEIGASTAQN